jgi:hypothetical protein
LTLASDTFRMKTFQQQKPSSPYAASVTRSLENTTWTVEFPSAKANVRFGVVDASRATFARNPACRLSATFRHVACYFRGLSMERTMHRFLSTSLAAMALSAALMAGGCASTDDVNRAQATADAAKMTADQALLAAQMAQARADQANATAQTAQNTANSAQSTAQAAAASADQAKEEATREETETTTRLARGERG